MSNSTKLCMSGAGLVVVGLLFLCFWPDSAVGRWIRSTVGVRNFNLSHGADWTWQGYFEVAGDDATSARAVGEADAATMMERREEGEDGDGAAPALYRATISVVSFSEGWWAPVWRTYSGELGIEDAWLSSVPDVAAGALLRDAAIDEAARKAPWLDRERIGEALRRAKIGADGRATAEVHEINVGGVVHDGVTIAGLVLIGVGAVGWARRREVPASSSSAF